METPTPPPARRKQLKEGMSHLQGFVTIGDTTSATPPPPVPEDAESSYGVPSTILPIRQPRTQSSQNIEKRTDPFSFGSRILEEGDDIFAYNAWDHVQVDDAYKDFAEECYSKQREAPVSDFDKKRFNEQPEKSWNQFYKSNTANFFKDRKWLVQEFPVLKEVMEENAGDKVILEVGAGAGNTAFPILKLNRNPGLRIHACDFSKTAVDVIKGNVEYTNEESIGKIEASVWDAAAVSEEGVSVLPEGIAPGSVDVLLMIFIFSALSPTQWLQAVRNVWHALKPGGVVLFRDYGRGDLAQVRFKKGRWMEENFYVRGDGTRVYFFEESELRDIWAGGDSPTFEVESFGVDRRMLVNRQRKLKMYRCWMQAVFRKTGSEQ